MTVHQLQGIPPPALAQNLMEFETQFTYPFGTERRFRISHGDDYPRFFRAMGEAVCFVAEQGGYVAGTLGASLRRLRLPNGRESIVMYLGDLKVSPAVRNGSALLCLMRSAQAWARRRVSAAFSVVMNGTGVTPDTYTGRLGVPPFRELGKVVVLRFSSATNGSLRKSRFMATGVAGRACYQRLSKGRYASTGGDPRERSETAPVWLIHPDGTACGCLEDTRRAKRLIDTGGAEMINAHLSCFAFHTPAAGAELILAALQHAGQQGFPALFVAVASPEVEGIRAALDGLAAIAAPATIYGTGITPGPLWNINTAEI